MIPRGGISGSLSGINKRDSQIGAPRPPIAPDSDPIGSSAITVNWRAPTIGTPSTYRVERGNDTITFTYLGDVSVAQYVDSTATALATYYYRITAQTADGDRGPSYIAGPYNRIDAPD